MRKIVALILGLLLCMAVVAPVAGAAPAGAFGVVLDQLGRPIPGAEIEFYRLGEGLVTTLTTTADGAFQFDRPVADGTLWQLRVWAKGYRTLESGWINLAANRYQSLRLEGMAGDLQVVVRDGQGRPASGMAILLGPGGRLESQVGLEEGQLVKEGLPAGAYQVLISAPGYAPATRTVTVAPDRVASTVVTLDRSGFGVTGEVLDQVTGAPIPGARVELQRQDQTHVVTSTTEGSGRFRLPATGEQSGSYRLWVTAQGYRAELTEPITIARGQEFDLSGGSAIQLQPLNASIAGTLLDRHGSTVHQAQVALVLQGHGQVAVTKTNNGNFRFDDLAAGPGYQYALVALEGTYDYYPINWTELKPGTTNQLVLQAMTANSETFGSGSLSGLVTTPSGTPIAGAKVELFRGGQVAKSIQTDQQGAFLIETVPATVSGGRSSSPYSVRISGEGYVTSYELTVDAKLQSGLDLAERGRTTIQAALMPDTVTVRGRVMDTDGAAVVGATVTLVSEGSSQQVTATTDQGGWYNLRSVTLIPGSRYALRVEAKGHLAIHGMDVTQALTKGQSLPTVRLPQSGATMTGQVLSPTGQPLAKVAVALRGPAGELLGETETDAGGYYRVAATLPRSGLLTLTASQPGWTQALAEILDPPAPGARLSRDLVIFPERATLEGRAMSAVGAAAADAWVDLLEEGKGVVQSVRASATGYFQFKDIALGGSGWYSLRVRPQGGGSFAGSLTHGTELVPMLRLAPGERTVTDLLVR